MIYIYTQTNGSITRYINPIVLTCFINDIEICRLYSYQLIKYKL